MLFPQRLWVAPWESQKPKSNLHAPLGFGEVEPWLCLSFRAVLGVVPKLQEILTVFRRYLESSGWPLELAVTQSGLELQSGGRPSGVRASSELGQKGRSGAAGCRRSSDKSTCPSALCPGSPGLRLASSLCHCAVSQGCPAGQIH